MRGPAWETFLAQPFDIGGGLDADRVRACRWAIRTSCCSSTATRHGARRPHRPGDRAPRALPGAHERGVRVRHDGVMQPASGSGGVGETMACGSGACAVAVAANEAGLVPSRTVVRFPGGDLEVERREDGEVLLTGEAAPRLRRHGRPRASLTAVVSSSTGDRRSAARLAARTAGPGRHRLGERRRGGASSASIRAIAAVRARGARRPATRCCSPCPQAPPRRRAVRRARRPRRHRADRRERAGRGRGRRDRRAGAPT